MDAVDAPGQFLLTGSAVPTDDAERHTGAGRFAFLRLRPMSLVESGAGQGGVSLAALLEGQPPSCADPGLGVADLAELVCRGGWPTQLERPLAADAGGADGPLDSRTVADHLQALERLMVLENQPAWRPHLRSKAALRQAPRRHFCDPSLAVAALGGSPDRLLKDLEWLGLLFESLVIRDLRVLAQALDGEMFHYRDDYGIEVDAIVQLRDGRWGAIEVKLGPGQVEAAAAGLLRFRQQIDTRRTGEPAFLAVICGSGYGYRRADGIAVVPVGALGP
ncbi:MAG: DUF4143 domain-containing protein [Cyanobacteria bacterium]|nr:DUF4143 domain-containing protein [Cyanobacteriota bacterium]